MINTDRPSFQFYPGDWQSNKNLRRCTHAEKGIWVDVMCLMHDSEEYGVLRWPLADLAQAVGCKVTDLQSLRAKDVLKGAEPSEVCPPVIYVPRSGRQDGEPKTLVHEQPGPIWYSSRMVKDEYKRLSKGDESRFGTAYKAQKHSPSASPSGSPTGTPRPPDGDGSSSSSSSSSPSSVSTPEKDIDHHEETAVPEKTHLAQIEDYLKGRTRSMMLGGTSLEDVKRWVALTGGNVQVVKDGIDAGFDLFRKEQPQGVPRTAQFYTGYVEKAWDRYKALGGVEDGRGTGRTAATDSKASGSGVGRERGQAGGNDGGAGPKASNRQGRDLNSLSL